MTVTPLRPESKSPTNTTLPTVDNLDGLAVLRHAITHAFKGKIAVVSSFGAESSVLLSMVADIDKATPVIFIETGQHFPETLEYRQRLVTRLGLTDVRDVGPSATDLAYSDPQNELWYYDSDACCRLRKVVPLANALKPFDAWVTGRKRHQAQSRTQLPFFELTDGKVKINPLADWSAERINTEIARLDLPQHPLVHRGFRSIGCAPCTRPVHEGEDARAGRWTGKGKEECGIHQLFPPSGI
jgi:phosphoadenosine phosphosulfate reductase